MRKFNIVPATKAYALELSLVMREVDKEAVYASSGATPLYALLRGMECTPYCWTAIDEKGPIAMWGIAEVNKYATLGLPWGLGTERMCTEYRIPFLREGLKCTKEGRLRYGALENWVFAKDIEHIRFIRWCGYRIHPAENHGFLNLPFHRFEMAGEA